MGKNSMINRLFEQEKEVECFNWDPYILPNLIVVYLGIRMKLGYKGYSDMLNSILLLIFVIWYFIKMIFF